MLNKTLKHQTELSKLSRTFFKCTIQNFNSSGFTMIFKSQPVLMRKLALGLKGVGQSLFPLGNTVQGSRTSSRNGTFSNPEKKVMKGNC